MSDERIILLLGELKGTLSTFQQSTDQRFEALEQAILRNRQEAGELSEKNHALRDEALAAHKVSTAEDLAELRKDVASYAAQVGSVIATCKAIHAKVTEARSWMRAAAFHGPGTLGVFAFLHAIWKGIHS